jgi:acyl-CoA thioester hydrolase
VRKELFRHRLSVRFRDCDPLGHVNHAVYLTYLEQARFMLWRTQLGFVARRSGLHANPSVGFILARAEIDYRAQARYGDELEVRLMLDAIGRTSFTYTYEIVGVADARVIAEARTVLVVYDYEHERPVPIDAELRSKLAEEVGWS